MQKNVWTREELIAAFYLYCRIPFGKIHLRNPQIIELAEAIGRSPSSVSWKLANFARLDPALKQRNIVGARHGSQAEVNVWNEFNQDWEKLAYEGETILARIRGHSTEEERFPEGKTRPTTVQARLNQGFFRAAVLAAHDLKCCVTGLQIPELLTASHIVPWSTDIKNRTNPRNGLCLNAVHDRAFDCGLMTITPDFKVRLSKDMRRKSSDSAAKIFLLKFDGTRVALPQRFVPEREFLLYHNEKIFRDSQQKKEKAHA